MTVNEDNATGDIANLKAALASGRSEGSLAGGYAALRSETLCSWSLPRERFFAALRMTTRVAQSGND